MGSFSELFRGDQEIGDTRRQEIQGETGRQVDMRDLNEGRCYQFYGKKKSEIILF